VSGGVKFPIFGERSFFTEFWKNEFFLEKVLRLVLAVLRKLLTNNGECITEILSGGYWRFCEKLDFSKMTQKRYFVM
jgi:hypothetical protein